MIHARTIRRSALFLSCCAGPALAEVATFDELKEGFQQKVMVSGGITFSRATMFPNGIELTFAIEDASGDMDILGFGDIWTSPNVMNTGGFATGPSGGFYRVHGWEAAVPGKTFTQGSVDVFHIDDFPGAKASLDAYLGDELVASDSFTIVNEHPWDAVHHHMAVSGAHFDRLVFSVFGGPGGEKDGILAVFDNVVMEGGSACYADFTGDGVLDLFDFLAYVNTFNAGDTEADCDQNGGLDLFDFLCFVNAFNAGC
jgi:hypothetical protein